MPELSLYRALRRRLAQHDAPRVLTPADLIGLATSIQPDVSHTAVSDTSLMLAEDGDLREVVSRRLWLNRCQMLPATAAEAAQHIRPGAIVSLQTVLGDAGVLHNYTHDVICLVPQVADECPSLTPFTAADGTQFSFFAMPEQMLFAPEPIDLYAPLPYPRATSEAALCHYLITFGKPPYDTELDDIDMERATRIAEAMGIAGPFQKWAETVDPDFDKMDGSPSGL